MIYNRTLHESEVVALSQQAPDPGTASIEDPTLVFYYTFDSDCGNSGYRTKCCAKTVMYDPETDTKDVNYRCMNRGMVQGDVRMIMGDFQLEMHCMGSSESSSVKLFGGVAAVATLATLTLF